MLRSNRLLVFLEMLRSNRLFHAPMTQLHFSKRECSGFAVIYMFATDRLNNNEFSG